jgi:phosphoribosylanthranilate isomerase
MPKVKICGLTNYNDALDAVNLGADFLGFHFIKGSPKKISEKLVSDIISKLPPFVFPVAVFCDEEEKNIVKIIKKLGVKYIQFNGNESPEICKSIREAQGVKIFKFFKINLESDVLTLAEFRDTADYFILDISCGENENLKLNFPVTLKVKELKIPFFISGNIPLAAVPLAVKEISPDGFEADSSVERLQKRKDYAKMNAFIKAARGLK